MTSIDLNRSHTELGKTETRFDREIGYSILRFTLGINILLHGLTPLMNLDSFVAGLLQSFAKTPLPPTGVHLFALMVPFAQASVGLLLTLGLLTRFALISGGLVMTALVFGTALRGDGPGVGIQMLYAVIYYLLLANRAFNRFSIDQLRQNRELRSRFDGPHFSRRAADPRPEQAGRNIPFQAISKEGAVVIS